MRECERERDVKFTTLVNIIEMIAVRENKVEIDKVFFSSSIAKRHGPPLYVGCQVKKTYFGELGKERHSGEGTFGTEKGWEKRSLKVDGVIRKARVRNAFAHRGTHVFNTLLERSFYLSFPSGRNGETFWP